MRRLYQVAALLMIAFGAWVIVESRNLNYYTELGPGPGFFPFWLALLVVVLSLVWLGQVTLQPVGPMEKGFVPSRAAVSRIASIVIALALWGLLVEKVGFQVMMFVFQIFLLVALGRQNLILTLAIALAASFGTYNMFTRFLDVQLPVSSIEFLQNLGL